LNCYWFDNSCWLI